VPKVGSLKELNNLLEDGCFAELERQIQGRPETVAEALRVERRALRELPFEDFDAAEHASPRVDSKALVTIRQNRDSVPVALVGLRVAARIDGVVRHGHDPSEAAPGQRPCRIALTRPDVSGLRNSLHRGCVRSTV